MKKSGKVIISVVLLSAVAQAKLQAQYVDDPRSKQRSDSASHNHSSYGRPSAWSRFRGFLFSRGPSTYRTPRPETGGFGSTVRPMLSSASS